MRFFSYGIKRNVNLFSNGMVVTWVGFAFRRLHRLSLRGHIDTHVHLERSLKKKKQNTELHTRSKVRQPVLWSFLRPEILSTNHELSNLNHCAADE